MISWYDTNGDVMETISVMSDDTIIYNNYFWTAINGSVDMEVINAILSTNTEKNIAADGVADYPAAIMVNDTVYLVEGSPMPTEVDESAIIGYTESYTDTFPENNGETNFNPELGTPYAQVEGGIAVLYKNEWYLGIPFSNEHTITFTGRIIDHTVESLVPVVCVRTLEEEVIPYEAVFFELPEGEEDWALKIGAEVLITCSGDFTEPAPHYGTLISIRNADTDVLSPLDGVTMEVTECSDTSVTVRIVNDTDKDIQCGEDFCLEMQDEETVKEFIDGDTIYELILQDKMKSVYVDQLRSMCTLLYAAHINIDYFPTNFVVQKGEIYYIDFECNEYMDEWNFENWGIKYWSKTPEFLQYVKEHS